MNFNNYDVGSILGVLLALGLVLSKNGVLQLLGIAFLVWRFGLGGCDGVPLPGCGVIPAA